MLVRAVDAIQPRYDVVVAPPSSREDSKPYKNALLQSGALDISDRFSRLPGVSAGRGATLEEMTAALSYSTAGDECGFRSLLIVDESFSRGTTAAAVLDHLRRAGLSDDCTVTIASAVWLPPDKPTSIGGSNANGPAA